jgi:predicted RecA/RadA family phage recombinase
MKNFVESGHAVIVAAPYAVEAGEGVKVNSLFGIAQDKVAITEDLLINREGVFNVKKATGTGTAIALTDKAYWDGSARVFTKTSSGNSKVGIPLAAAADGDATVRVLLVPNI